MTPNGTGPDFTTKLEGHAYARFSGPHNPDSVKALCEFLKKEKWLGNLRVHFNDGGMTDAVFEEIKKMSITKT